MQRQYDPANIPTLLRQLHSRNERTQLTAVGELMGIALQRGGAAAIAAAGGIPTLLQLMNRPVASQMQHVLHSLVCGVLQQMADSRGSHGAFMEAGALPSIVSSLVGSSSPSAPSSVQLTMKLAAASMAAALLAADNPRHAECRDALAAAGAGPALVRLLSGGLPGLPQMAAWALSGMLAGDSEAASGLKAAAVEGGAVPALASLLEADHLMSGHDELAALQRLASGGAECKAAIAAAGIIPKMVCLMKHTEADDLLKQRGAVGVLHSLALGGAAAHLQAMAAAGAVQALQRLQFTSADEQLQRSSEALLCMLAAPLTPSAPAGQPSPPAESGTAPSASQAPSAPAASSSRPRPPAPRVCAAPGCGATHKLRRCAGCGTVRYCSEACSREHWRAHRADCQRVQVERAAAAAAATSSASP